MTHSERALIEARRPHLDWATHQDPRFTRLVGSPACPLLTYDEAGQAGCSIHDIRPYNCRRWGCFRSSIDEPFDNLPVQRRLATDRSLRRQAMKMQRKAQRWAIKHGWGPDV